MGVYLYDTEGKKVFFKDPSKSNEMIAAGYTFEPVKQKEKTEEKVDKKAKKNRFK